MERRKDMRKFGAVRRVDDLGRIVIPKDIRDRLGLPIGARLEVYATEDGKIVAERLDDSCALCGASETRLIAFFSKFLCEDCVDKLQDTKVGKTL
jgi:transcriptional pleiotropic regulator of transition state genes